MIRYVVLKDRKQITDYCVVEVRVDKDELKSFKEFVTITFFNGKSRLIKNDWVYKTKEEAYRVAKERAIIKKFKNKCEKKEDGWVCSACGRLVSKESITVDHIKPIYLFKEKGEYISYTHWKICWSEANLTLMCESCNYNKSSMHIKKHLRLNKKSTFQKLSIFKRKKRKIRQCSMELARRDSRILDKNTILRKKPKVLKEMKKVRS